MRIDKPWLIYGAYGYTGRLIAQVAVMRGHRPVLAGRDADRIRALANELNLEHRAFSLDDRARLREGLDGIAAVLQCAGPFSGTYRSVVEACLETGTHYLDITGEIDVFEAIQRLDGTARERGVVLLPGVGFDVVPTDCAAARVAERITDPIHLEIAFESTGSSSRGTAKTMLEGLTRPGRERRDGKIVEIPHGAVRRRIPFTDREREAVSIPWGDVSTAWYSTGIPNIRVFLVTSRAQLRGMRLVGWVRPVLGMPVVQSLLAWRLNRAVPGPDERERAGTMARIWCEVRNASSESASVELNTPNSYDFTAESAVSCVEALLYESYGGPIAGALTPSMAFGHSFVDTIRGVTWLRS